MYSIKLSILVFVFALTGCAGKTIKHSPSDKQASVFPDYNGVAIPPNIAPLNFCVRENAEKYLVEIYADKEHKIAIRQRSPKIKIPPKKWRALLNNSKGKNLNIDIYAKNKDKWVKYPAMVNLVAHEEIDNYLVYRLINTQYMYSRNMGLFQRNLGTFDESLIFENSVTKFGCFNCHSFSQNNPRKMSLHFRQEKAGTLILNGNDMAKLDTKTGYTMSTFGYASFNPNGVLVAYSVNIFNEYFLNDKNNLNEVTDEASDIVVYNIETNTLTTSPKISTKSRENFPTWSPDGKYLYFLSAPETKGDFETRYYAKYSLLKIPYDLNSNTWGDLDTVLSAHKTGKSITFPRISPDGRYLLFCMINHGYFSINHKESDLYLMDLETQDYHKLDISSPMNDSYHAWSKNGRWVVFSSKRHNNAFSLPYFSYFDKNGKAHKPFVLPQKDPLFYESFLSNFNLPELVTGKVGLNPRKILDKLNQEPVKVQFDPSVDLDALSGASKIFEEKLLGH